MCLAKKAMGTAIMYRVVVSDHGAEFEVWDSPFEQEDRAQRCAEALMGLYVKSVTHPPRIIRILNTDNGRETVLEADDFEARQ